MRHPKGPVQPDALSDMFPLHIYISVLTALANNPKIGQSPDNYDQKFLVDSQILDQGIKNPIVKELLDSAPEEIGNLIDLLNAPYEQTPLIVEPSTVTNQFTPVILSSDWMELFRHVGETVEVTGFIKQLSSNGELTLTNPSAINHGVTVTIRPRRPSRTPIRIGDYIRAVGKVNIELLHVTINSTSITVDNDFFKQGSESVLFAGIRNRINDAIKRIRDLRVP
jgi:hypothetical protein